jgi:ribose transport system substrate-binding protein
MRAAKKGETEMQLRVFSSLAASVAAGLLLTGVVQPAFADVSEAKKIVANAMKAPDSFVAPGPAFDANKIAGKTLWYISFSEQSPVMATWSGTIQRVIQSYGGKVNIVDGKSNFSEFGRLIEQAVANHADAIVLMGIPPQAFSVQMQQAKDARIPVIVGSNGVAAIPETNGVVAAATIDHAQVGKLLGAWVVADTGGNGQSVVVTHDEVMGTKTIVDSLSGEVSRLCGSACDVKAENLPFTRIQTEGEVTQSLAARNPNLKYIIPVYDFEALTMAPALQSAGAADRVSLASFNAIPAVMQKLKKGEVAADVGAPNGWFGYAMADQVMRVMGGIPPVADMKVPLRLFTRENIDGIDLDAGEGNWYGTVEFPVEYRKLWGAPKS